MEAKQKTLNENSSGFFSKLKILVEITRPLNVAMVAVGVFIATLAGLGEIAPFVVLVPAIFAAMLISAAGNALNDYYDIEIDNINRPHRPLPSGKIAPIEVWAYAIVLFASGVVLSLFLPILSIIIAAVNSILLAFYASHIKKSGFFGNLLISYLVASVFAFGSAAVGNLKIGAFLAIAAFFTNAGREVLKNLEDIRGDKMFGAKTIPILEGGKKSLFIIAAFLVVSILVSPIPYFLGILSLYYLIVAFFADGIFISVILFLYKSKTLKTVSRCQQLIKVGAIIGLIAFLVGTIPL